jgi:hypothetical protein
MPEVSSYPSNPDVSQYSPYGRDYGNGILNLLAFSSFGFNYAPKPQGAQGMYDAYYQRERSRQFMGIQQDAFANNMLFKQAGFDPENNLLQFAGKAFGSPDGMVARMLSPLIGGNPMAAQMQLYAGLSGASVMGAFGRIGDVSKEETDDMMRVVEKNFYRTTPIDQVEKEMDQKFSQELQKNPEYARQLGVGVPMTSAGYVDEEAVEALQSRGAEREEEALKLKTLAEDFKLNDKPANKKQYSPEIAKNVNPRLEKALKSAGVSDDRLAELKNTPTGDVDLFGARKELSKLSEGLKTKEEYGQEVADRMADKMGIIGKKNFTSREIEMEGGVPTKIDGRVVPVELHTQEQRDNINSARQVVAEMHDQPTPPIYGEGVAPAPAETYDDIVKPEQNGKKRETLEKAVKEGFRSVDVLEQNERNRKNAPYNPIVAGTLSSRLEKAVLSSGLADRDQIEANRSGRKPGNRPGELSAEFIEEITSRGGTSAKKLEELGSRLERNEKTKADPSYDEGVSKELNDEITKTLTEEFNVSQEDISKATGRDGKISTEFVKEQAEKRQRAVREIGGMHEQVAGMREGRKAQAWELAAYSKDIEQEIRKSGVLTEEQIAAGKTEEGAVTSDLVDKYSEISDQAIKEISGLSSELSSTELKSTAADYDKELSKAISDRIKEKLEKSFGATEDELAKAVNATGVIDSQYVKAKMAEQEKAARQVRKDFREFEELQKPPAAEEAAENLEDKAKDQQENIRKTLKEVYNVSDEKLAEVTDDRGNIDPEFVKEVYSKELDRSAIEKAGLDFKEVEKFKLSKEAPRMRAQYFDRQMQAAELEEIQQEISSARKEDTEESRERAKKLNIELKEKLKKLGVSDEDIEKNASDSEGGFLGFGSTKYLSPEFIARQKEQLTKKTYADVEAQRMVQYQQAGFKYSGINFEKTRGFNIEDFTSAFTAASDMRLIGGKGTPVEKMEGFMQNSGGALSAARSVFGDNLSGGQLVGKISDLLGSKAQNLTSQEGSAEVEKMLRDVKSTARVAGISIDALLGVIDAAKEVARSNPRLRQMSSAAITDMSLKALSTTAGMAGAMNAAEYRASGGTQQMLGEKVGEQQKLLSSDVGQSMIALQQKFAGDPKKMEAFKRAMKKGGFDERGVTERDIPAVVQAILQEPEMAGVSQGELYFALNDSTLRELGTKNADIMNYTEGVMSKGANQKFYRHIKQRTGMSKEEFINKYQEKRKENENLTFEQYVSGELGGKDPVALNLYKELKQTIEEDVYRKTDPELFKKIEETRKRQTELDTELDKKLGGRNAPIITQIVDELSRGDKLDATKTEKLMRIFADENVYKDKGEMERLQTGFTQAVEAAAIQDSEGVAEGLSKALDIDISEKDLKNIQAGGKVTSNYKEAQNEYRRLKEGGAKTSQEKQRLKAYEAMEKIGLIDTDSSSTAKQKAFEVFQQGEGVAGITAGAVEAEKNRKNQEQIAEVKKGVTNALGEELEAKAKSTAVSAKDRDETQRLIDYYEDKGGTEQMMKDAASGSGAFDAKSEVGQTFNQEEGSAVQQVKARINEANEQIKQTEEKVAGSGEGSGSAEGDLAKQIKDLIKSLEEGKLTGALTNIAANLQA